MSLNISTPLQTVYGFTLENAYGRVAVVNEFKGDEIRAAVEFYADAAAFEAGATAITVVGVNANASTSYDYTTSDKDILDLAHDILIAALHQQGITATKNL